ncbi:MAG TPA: hypothetical protein PLA96_03120, partial [Candidatus Brocadia sapporoensis]|nr:hypothetical protein [Candidatus Brocadia sapporoensis]
TLTYKGWHGILIFSIFHPLYVKVRFSLSIIMSSLRDFPACPFSLSAPNYSEKIFSLTIRFAE